jgi:hypothetical protein
MADASETDPTASETVLRFLDRSAPITTRYGGGFVQSIDGLAGAERDGRRYDWFFYVNGIESPIGSTDVTVHGGDRIWWDYRDWTSAMRVPAVVGSFPQPFLAAADGQRAEPTKVECRGATAPCREAAGRLQAAGLDAQVTRKPAAGSAPRVLVGPWKDVRRDPAVDALRGGPAATGLFATFKGPIRNEFHLIALDTGATPVRDLGPGAGLVAALDNGENAPIWIVTGSTGAAVGRGADLLTEHLLHDRYALAAPTRGAPLPLPVVSSKASGG